MIDSEYDAPLFDIPRSCATARHARHARHAGHARHAIRGAGAQALTAADRRPHFFLSAALVVASSAWASCR